MKLLRIGIDFDNTIACYDGVFYRAALERGLIPAATPQDKTSVRNYLRRVDREDDWTELQGYVYGARMDLVDVYPGFREFVAAATRLGHSVSIISHKTRSPFRGPTYDLHQAALDFLGARLLSGPTGLVPSERVFFELTIDAKIARIVAEDCDIFIDDLPELLADASFPTKTRAILFDPERHHQRVTPLERAFESYANWDAIADAITGVRRTA